MKKIGIMTACRTDNNGTDLQCLAMLLIAKQIYDDVEIIDYRCPRLEETRKVFSFDSLGAILRIPFRLFDHLQRERFRNKYINYSSECYNRNNIESNGYEVIIVGSDQIWNLLITGDDCGFFLPYDNKSQVKCTYAVSFGNQGVEPILETYEEYLKCFSFISVREESNLGYFKKAEYKSRNDLDPLLMIDSHKWNDYSKKNKNKSKYAIIYLTKYDKDAFILAKKISRDYDLKLYCIGGTYKAIPGIRNIRFISIADWIGYLSEAEIVFSDSYHCISFAINYQKRFVVTNLKAGENDTRIKDLLHKVGIFECESGVVCSPDWDRIGSILKSLRLNSFNYLSEIIKGNVIEK